MSAGVPDTSISGLRVARELDHRLFLAKSKEGEWRCASKITH
jgi:hypothetical protein